MALVAFAACAPSCGGKAISTAGADGGTGGSGGVGGGGTAGSSATTPCEPGAVCPVENKVCVPPGCCQCTYRCTGGRWQVDLCPSCAAPFCPEQEPVVGQRCGRCQIPTEGCYFDKCPAAPQLLYRCVDEKWTAEPQQSCNACCKDDGECGGGQICVSTVCKERGEDRCWRDDQCGPGRFCAGAFVCPCTADCDSADSAGRCVSANSSRCCHSDADCSTGYCAEGVCMPRISNGCWSDRDCPGTSCRGAHFCACDEVCLELIADRPGQCG